MASPDYSTPSWLQAPAAPNPATAFIGGLGHGVQIGRDRARMAQQAQEMSARLAMEQRRMDQQRQQEELAMTIKQQQLQQDNMIALQKLEIEKSYRDQQNEVRKGVLEQQQKRVALVAQQAAQKFAAQNEYQKALSEIDAMAENGDLSDDAAADARQQALLKFAPMMGAPLGSLAQLAKSRFNPSIEVIKGPDGKLVRVLRRSPENVQLLDRPTTGDRATVTPFGVTYSGDPNTPEMKARIAAATAPSTNAPPGRGLINSLLDSITGRNKPNTNAPTATPAPTTAPAPVGSPATPKSRYIYKDGKIIDRGASGGVSMDESSTPDENNLVAEAASLFSDEELAPEQDEEEEFATEEA